MVEGKEDFLVSHLESFHYIEGEREIKEIMFQLFEVVNFEMVCPTRDKPKKSEFPIASLQDALTII